MPTFQYKAKGADGAEYEKTADAPDRFSLFRQVKKEGGIVLSVHEAAGKRAHIKKLNNLFSRVSMHERIEFARNLGSMLEAGLTVTRSLAVFEKQTRNASFKAILSSIRDKIEKGARLSDALKEYPKVFSALFTSMTHAGEES